MTQAMHDLPLIWSEPSHHIKIFKQVLFVMNKVVSYSQESNQEERAEKSITIGDFALVCNVD